MATSNCPLCEAHCGLEVDVAGGRVIAVSGGKGDPDTQGFICPKGRALLELQNSSERLRVPLRRNASGGFDPIGWEEALEEIAARLVGIREQSGAAAVAVHVGRAGVDSHFIGYAQLFTYLFGSPNFAHAGSYCYMSKVMANTLTYGGYTAPDLSRAGCIVLWGHNPSASCPALTLTLRRQQKRGARLIVVDPFRTPLARAADVHLQLRPGTDGAVALGLLHVMVQDGLVDTAFVEQWALGYEPLQERVAGFDPEYVEEVSWVPADELRRAARTFAAQGPGCVVQGLAAELHVGGIQAIRGIAALQALAGYLDVPGGALLRPRGPLASLGIMRRFPTGKAAIGQRETPLFVKLATSAQANLYARAVLEGEPYPVRAMLVHGSNPLLTWPGGPGTVRQALERLDFLVVMDHFLTASARLADLVLPAATCFEHDELYDRFGYNAEPRLIVSGAVVQAEGPLSDWEFFRRLSLRLGVAEGFPWVGEREAISARLAPLGVTAADLVGRPQGLVYGKHEYQAYERYGFRTPSGKVELWSERVAEVGQDPLPAFLEPAESPLSTPDVAADYPLILTTGARHVAYVASRGRNLPSLRRLMPEPVLDIHPQTAAALGVAEGGRVRVVSPRGAVEVKASLTADLDPRVIRLLHGWEEANANLLTHYGAPACDPISGFPSWRAFQARVEPVSA